VDLLSKAHAGSALLGCLIRGVMLSNAPVPAAVSDPVNAAILAISEDRLAGFQEDPFGEIARRAGFSVETVIERVAAMLADAVLNRGVSSMRPTPDLLAYLGDRAGGNPFFVEELVRALQEAGGLQQHDDGISLKRRAAEKLPATLT